MKILMIWVVLCALSQNSYAAGGSTGGGGGTDFGRRQIDLEIASVALPLRENYQNQITYLKPRYSYNEKSGRAWVETDFASPSQLNLPMDVVDFRGSWQVQGLHFDALKRQILFYDMVIASLKKGIFGLEYLEETNAKLDLSLEQRDLVLEDGWESTATFEVLRLKSN